MEFKYEKKFENNEKWYTVGVVFGLIKDEELYAVEVMDPAGRELCETSEWKIGSVAVAVFGITEDEFNMFSENIEAFDALVDRLKADIPKDRLFAEKNCVRKTDRKETIDENDEFKKYIAKKVKKTAPQIDTTPKEVIDELLGAEKICVAYSAVTDRPVLNVVNDKANLILTPDEKLMDAFVKSQKNLYKKVFLKDVINSEKEESVFSYFYKIGINMMGVLLPDNRVLNFPMEALLNSDGFKAKKDENAVSNPALERNITCFFQLFRTHKPDETNRETFNKNMSFLDIRIMEEALSAKFLLAQRAKKNENGGIEFELSVVEQKETGERLIPVASCDEEYVSGEGFQKIIVGYDKLCEVVKNSGLSGFVVNCKSKCSYKFNTTKMEQVEKFRAWKEEQIKKQQQNED